MGDQFRIEAELLWVSVFRDLFWAEFVAKFLAIKVETKISGLSLDLELWPGMVVLCEMFLCVISGDLITC